MEPAVVAIPQNVDPGEAILAVVGVRPLLTSKIERITAPMWEQINRIEFRISRLAQQLCRGTLEAGAGYPELDYEPFLDAFTKPPEVDQIEAMLEDIPIAFVPSFLNAAVRAYNYLRDRFPICVEKTVFGSTQLEPGTFARGMFEDLLEVVDRPLSVFGAIEDGRLTTRQAQALKDVYPSLYAEMCVALVERCMTEKGDHPTTWDPTWDRGLSVMLGIPGVDPGLRAGLAVPPPAPARPQRQAMPGRSSRAGLIANKADRLELEEQG